MVKRGRKPKKEPYFGINEEMAVVKFITSEDYSERERIYNEELKKPIEKLVENIINTYKLHRKGYSYDEIHADTLSFLMCQSNKFRPEENKKAYSYYGTICKNYLMAEIQKDNKHLKRNNSFDDYFSHIEERDDMVYVMDDHNDYVPDLIVDVIDEIKKILDDPTLEGKKKLSENEIKIGLAVIEILSNWKQIFGSENHTPKYDKISILETIRNYTSLTTKEIRFSMDRFKILYKFIKNDKINDGLI